MTYKPYRHKCIACYYPIEDGEEEGFIKMARQPRYYHVNWEDCQKALRGLQPKEPVDEQEMQDA